MSEARQFKFGVHCAD